VTSHLPEADLLVQPLSRTFGAGTAKALASLGLTTVGDLLWHVPRRYVRRGELTDLASLEPGEQATVLARVESVRTRPMRRKRGQVMDVVVTDGSDLLRLTFFSTRGPQRQLSEGRVGLFAGTVDTYQGSRQLVHPEFLLLDATEGADTAEAAQQFAGDLIPVYAATRSMSSWRLAKAVDTVLRPLRDLPDPVPTSVRRRRGLLDRLEALRTVHDPVDSETLARATFRLRYEEAFVLQVELARRRAAAQAMPATPRHEAGGGLLVDFDRQRPFPLTGAQQAVGEEIAAELARSHPMHRLLHGDVGSGKTVVALRAMLAVVDAGGQAALLAPTEVLAQQHYRTLQAMLGPLAEQGLLGGAAHGTRVVLLTGSATSARRRQTLLDIASGTAGIVVGTHALLSETVQFFDLGLVVIDEQHRFGVEQRAALAERAGTTHRPHVLVLTATPIPRTIAMTVFGDLDVSVLAELPPGRAPIVSHVVPVAEKPHYVERVWQRVREEAQAGNRAYVVCPRIGGEPETSGGGPGAEGEGELGTSVLELVQLLRGSVLPDVQIGVLHGRLSAEDKDAAMSDFSSGVTPVLVATTVIEVGVDVSEASIMVVMDADRFGVAQLHQLRGRVGRGSEPSVCLLLTRAPAGSPARQRLEAVAATTDGFALAELDLAQRREGDLLGVAQSGRQSSLRLLSLQRDLEVIELARDDATDVVEVDPNLTDHPELAVEVERMTAEKADYLERA
jgi:ATP-dependent DNA helicase RecG